MSDFERKPGVYLCGGCGIADALDMDDMEQDATGGMEYSVPLCRKADSFCSGDGYAQLKQDVDSGEVNQAIIAGCSPRVMTREFDELGAQIIRANIREQVIWTQPPNDEDTQMFAKDNVRMAIAQAQGSVPPQPHENNAKSHKILVVGGGVTGMAAALEAAQAGSEVVLLDKADKLGGWAAKWSKTVPERPPYRGLQGNPVADMIAEIEENTKITVKTGAIVTETRGMPGNFQVRIGDEDDVFGAIVVATGWRPYDISGIEEFNYNGSDDIITDIEFEELAASGEIKRKSDGKTPKIAAFVVASSDEVMPYSSGVSSKVAIKQALQLVENDPDAMAYIIYEELRTHGTSEEFYREAQEKGVIFQKGTVKSITSDLTVTVDDELLGQEIPMSGLDMVVISSGMVPNSTNPDLEVAEKGNAQLKDDIDPSAEYAERGLKFLTQNDDEGEPALPGGPILNLQYRQGPHIPVLANGFLDSHYICFPYETRRTGIYTAGPVRRPMTMGEAMQDAQGAVLKAIQSIYATESSQAVHPRSGDLSFPKFGLDICTKCRRCTVECPFGAIDEDPETDYPVLNPSRCRRCGTCMGACPVRTITFDNYSPQMVSEMISAVEMPDEFDEKPRILVFACENDAYPALDMAGINRKELNSMMRFVPVRCLGSVTLLWISTALEKGYDGVMLMGCKSGDDYQCHFIKGSAMATERMAKVGDTLQSLMLEEERVRVEEVSIADSFRITEMLNGFGSEIKDIGLNPFKGF
jgi:quinone-modifying oxidoreductase subunit QmoB